MLSRLILIISLGIFIDLPSLWGQESPDSSLILLASEDTEIRWYSHELETNETLDLGVWGKSTEILGYNISGDGILRTSVARMGDKLKVKVEGQGERILAQRFTYPATIFAAAQLNGVGGMDVVVANPARRGTRLVWSWFLDLFTQRERHRKVLFGHHRHTPLLFGMRGARQSMGILRSYSGGRAALLSNRSFSRRRTHRIRLGNEKLFKNRPMILPQGRKPAKFVFIDSDNNAVRVVNYRGRTESLIPIQPGSLIFSTVPDEQGTASLIILEAQGRLIFPEGGEQFLETNNRSYFPVPQEVELMSSGDDSASIPATSPTKIVSKVPSITATPTASVQPSPTLTPVPTPTPTATATIINTPTVTLTPTSTLTSTSTPTPTQTFTPTNASPSGTILCTPAKSVGKAGSTMNVQCSGAVDPEGSQVTYKFANRVGNCPQDSEISSTGSLSAVVATGATTCRYTLRACDMNGACSEPSPEFELHGYELSGSLGSFNLNQNGDSCNVTLPFSVSSSTNVSGLQYSAVMTGLSGTSVSSSSVQGELVFGSSSVSGSLSIKNATIAGITVSDADIPINVSLVEDQSIAPLDATVSSVLDIGRLTPGLQHNKAMNGAECILCEGLEASVASGLYHSCAIRSDGTLWCWGRNQFGQLGNGTYNTSNYPVKVSGLSAVIQVSAGGGNTCAVVGNQREVWCWGHNTNGMLGNGSTVDSAVPVQVSGLSGVRNVQVSGHDGSAGGACALLLDRSVWCWGSDAHGSLGTGTMISSSTTPVQVVNLVDPIDLSVGERHSCALQADGVVKCWGFNLFGPLGDGTTTSTATPVQLDPIPGKVISRVEADRFFDRRTYLYTDDNEVWEVGSGNLTASLAESLTSPALPGGSGSTTMRCYIDSQTAGVSCSVVNSGGCLVGSGHPGTTLGNGSVCIDSGNGLQITGLESEAVALSTGEKHSCAVKANGEVHCFGDNSWGQFGIGSSDVVYAPTAAYTGRSVSKVALNTFSSCIISTTGTVWCVGRNSFGQLGDGSNTSSTIPVEVSGISNASEICARGHFDDQEGYCVIDGTQVKCWGYRYTGDGSNLSRTSPTVVSGLSDITPVDIACGAENTCVQASTGEVRCWGHGGVGLIGNNANNTELTPVSTAAFGGSVTGIGGVREAFCASIQGGGVECWGRGSGGVLGDGSNNNGNNPDPVSNLTAEVSHIADSGGRGDNPHMCVSLTSGGIRCWGASYLGNGSTGNSNTPVTVTGYDSVIINHLAVGDDHTCAVRSDGQLACWGENRHGQLGVELDSSTTPLLVPGITNAIYVAASSHATCVVLSDNSMRCFGYNAFGQLGINHQNSLTAQDAVVMQDTTTFTAQVKDCRTYSK